MKMRELGAYNSLEELKEYFDVEYINTVCDFYALLKQTQKDENVLYRGVCSARYKMYSSAQRFYHENRNAFGFEYTKFISKLYEVSQSIDNGYLRKLYDDLQKDNYIQYEVADKDRKSERIYLDYNPIWAFHTLQHFTQCSPFLDFSTHFYIALYFAAQDISPLWSNCVPDIDNYIEIVLLKESVELYNLRRLNGSNLYKSLTDEVLGDKKCNIETFLSRITEYDGNAIKYICYGGEAKTLFERGSDYYFSFKNENCIAQSGRLYLTSCKVDKPFEVLWNDIFDKTNETPKLKVYLIHKSLIDEIYKYLTIHLLGKVVVPIQKDYKNEIIELIKQN